MYMYMHVQDYHLQLYICQANLRDLAAPEDILQRKWHKPERNMHTSNVSGKLGNIIETVFLSYPLEYQEK